MSTIRRVESVMASAIKFNTAERDMRLKLFRIIVFTSSSEESVIIKPRILPEGWWEMHCGLFSRGVKVLKNSLPSMARKVLFGSREKLSGFL